MSDRIFGLVIVVVALAFIASATQIQTSFLSDPLGPKAFPVIIGVVGALSGLTMIWRPDPDPVWPVVGTLVKLALAAMVLIVYAYALKPLGFILPTIIASGILSYQIESNAPRAALAGLGLAILLFIVFRFALGLSLVGLPGGVPF